MTPDTTLTKSRWRLVQTSHRFSSFLDALDINYRKVVDQTFWEANKEHLHSLYAQMLEEARSKMRDLHPDTGGNAAAFRNFVSALALAKKQFARNVTPEINKPAPTVVFQVNKRQRGLRDHGFVNPTRALAIMRMLLDRRTCREISREEKCPLAFVLKVKRKMAQEQIPPCDCGKSVGHKGWCEFTKARYPKYQHFITEILPVRNKAFAHKTRGRPKSAEHRRRIALALRGKPKSHEAVANSVAEKKRRRLERLREVSLKAA